MDNTATFLTAAFGIHDLFEDVFAARKNRLRYLILETKMKIWKNSGVGKLIE